jgi:hypothetical protein
MVLVGSVQIKSTGTWEIVINQMMSVPGMPVISVIWEAEAGDLQV